MTNEVPPILWYLLWAFVLTVLPIFMVTLLFRRRMKALEILKSYAEKQVEPPAAIIDLLANEVRDASRSGASKTGRDARFGGFLGFTFLACTLGAVAWWRFDTGGPSALLYGLVGAGSFFGIGAMGFLIVAIFTRDK